MGSLSKTVIEGCNISSHEKLRETCVLAAAGDIPSAELEHVRAHLNECESCRLLFREVRDIHALQLAHIPSCAIYRTAEQEAQLKDSILRAARAEKLTTVPLVALAAPYEKPAIKSIGLIPVNRRWFIGASLGVLAACITIVVAVKAKLDLNEVAPESVAPISAAPVSSIPSVRAEQGLGRDEQMLRVRLDKIEADRTRLERLLEESQGENASLKNSSADVQQQVASLSRDLDSARAAENSALQRLEQLRVERQNDQSAIIAQNREIRSLNEKLENQETTKDTNKNVVDAENDLRNWVGSRNLHIVDVYDTDIKGKTKKAVGRVFYAEGKALVFYAFDLSNGHSDSAKYAYYVWGNKDGNLEAVRNLGTLGVDDQQQRRWKLQVNDENALAEIDRVFVTVEQVGKLGPRPQGKKILSAYLGGPVNHP